MTDCNSLLGTVSFKKYSTTTANRPANDAYGCVITIDYNQFAFGGRDNKLYVRRYTSNAWGSWMGVSVS